MLRVLVEELRGLFEGEKFIQRAIKKPGQLHKDLGYPEGADIPDKEIEAAAKGKGKVAQRARFALVLRKIRRKKGK